MKKYLYWILCVGMIVKSFTTYLIPLWRFGPPNTCSFSFPFALALCFGIYDGVPFSLLYQVFLGFLLVGVPLLWIVCDILFCIHPRIKKAKSMVKWIAVVGLLSLNLLDIVCCIWSAIDTPLLLFEKGAMSLLNILWILLLVLYVLPDQSVKQKPMIEDTDARKREA